MLRQLPAQSPDPNLLVSAATGDDAGVYRLTRNIALVQTADFFTPIVDDPFAFGQIAAANSLSDVYAMGGRPINALNLLGVPGQHILSAKAVASILRGGMEVARQARCIILGGHTMHLPEPFYGMAVSGVVSPSRIIANANARPGDILVLTKPLGIGIVTTAIKMNKAPRAIVSKALRTMRHLNSAGADLGEKRLVRAGTDVTGFGLVGHLAAICRASKVSAELEARALPVLGKDVFKLMDAGCVPAGSKQNLLTSSGFTDWGTVPQHLRVLATDAQTSGGLLICVPRAKLERVMKLLKSAKTPCAAVIGRITPGKAPLISVS